MAFIYIYLFITYLLHIYIYIYFNLFTRLQIKKNFFLIWKKHIEAEKRI